jgi:site-specific DNA-methyltransferase (adenine-specific)
MIKEETKGYKPSKSSAQRNADGTTSKLKYEQGKKLRNKWNVWVYEVGYNKTTLDKESYLHPAMFPEKLVQDHVLSWSNAGDIIYDPFMGSGTTAKMALLNGRNYIGSEISSEYVDIAEQRLSKYGVSNE